ncbi:MAG: beta-galactosidase [Anaerolineae bacterium]|nr:beta-galactosidase [Anaerolineae bacterium]
MTTVKIAEKKLWVGETAIPLLSGEVHYWRLDPHNWWHVLQAVREVGLKVVATYVCWDFHEIAPGRFDFTGETDPRRNLIGFLELLTAEGFWIILRPGPYIYSEWSNNGVPDHAAQGHRLDPAYLDKAGVYMKAVTEAARPYLATNGGRIIVWQADNEIDPWPQFYAEQLGLGQQPGPFHDFLRERYPTVAALNAAWRTTLRSIDEARAVLELFSTDPGLASRYNDYRAFVSWYTSRAAAQSVETYRSLGVDVPILLNTYSGVGVQRWADFEAIADLAGPDIYPSREFLYRTGEHQHILEGMRYARTFSSLPYIPEYQAGIWHDWLEDVGTLTPNHYRMICLAALQGGAAGWNWYMLVNRDNWYQSPINEWGRTRPELFAVFQQITRLFETVDPTTLQPAGAGAALTFDPLQRGTERPGQALLQSCFEAAIDYDFWDLSQDAITDKPLLFYAGGAWLSAEGQARLAAYVEGGGHLVCVGAFPKLDEHLLPLNLLGIPEPDGVISGVAAPLNLAISGGAPGDSTGFAAESPWAFTYGSVPGEPITALRLSVRQQPSEELALQFNLQTGTRYTVGYSLQRGQGRLTMLGLKPTPELLLGLHRHLGVSIPCRSLTPAVTATLFWRGQEVYVFVVNSGAEGKAAEIVFDTEAVPDGRWVAEDLVSGRVATITLAEGRGLAASLPRKDGTIIRLTPAGV